jgi:hypothetical protein
MEYFKVNRDILLQSIQEEETICNRLAAIESSLSTARSGLTFQIRSRQRIDNNLQGIINTIEEYRVDMGRMKSALENIYQAYENTENQVASASVKSDIASTASATTATTSAAATTAAATASGAGGQSASATATDGTYSSIINNSVYADKVAKFRADERYSEGSSWDGDKPPEENDYKSCQGCCAFAADFIKCVYGKNGNFSSNATARYTDASQIQAGDVIHITDSQNPYYTHWFVVLERNGDTLTVAEGNYLNSDGQTIVHYSEGDYKIQNGQLVERGNTRTIERAFHFT